MGVAAGFAKFMFYPVWRVQRDFRTSGGNIAKAFSAAKEAVRATAAQPLADADHAALPVDSCERFEFLARKHQLSDRDIAEQRDAVYIGKLLSLFGIGVVIASDIVTATFGHGLVVVLAVPITLSSVLWLSVHALRFGLYQSQLEDRRLYSFKEFLGRPDLFAFLIG